VKRTILLATLFAAALFILLPGCGDPAIGTLQSITLSTSNSDLYGEGGVAQLTATGNYTSKATKTLTGNVTYTVTPVGYTEEGAALPATSATKPQTVSVSTTGLVEAVAPFVCTWHNYGTTTSPSWALTGSYEIVATFDNVTSNPVYMAVASAVGEPAPSADNGLCGPTPTAQ